MFERARKASGTKGRCSVKNNEPHIFEVKQTELTQKHKGLHFLITSGATAVSRIISFLNGVILLNQSYGTPMGLTSCVSCVDTCYLKGNKI